MAEALALDPDASIDDLMKLRDQLAQQVQAAGMDPGAAVEVGAGAGAGGSRPPSRGPSRSVAVSEVPSLDTDAEAWMADLSVADLLRYRDTLAQVVTVVGDDTPADEKQAAPPSVAGPSTVAGDAELASGISDMSVAQLEAYHRQLKAMLQDAALEPPSRDSSVRSGRMSRTSAGRSGVSASAGGSASGRTRRRPPGRPRARGRLSSDDISVATPTRCRPWTWRESPKCRWTSCRRTAAS